MAAVPRALRLDQSRDQSRKLACRDDSSRGQLRITEPMPIYALLTLCITLGTKGSVVRLHICPPRIPLGTQGSVVRLHICPPRLPLGIKGSVVKTFPLLTVFSSQLSISHLPPLRFPIPSCLVRSPYLPHRFNNSLGGHLIREAVNLLACSEPHSL